MSDAMVKTEEEAEYLVSQIAASFSFEGMDIPKNERDMLKKVAMGEVSYENYMKQLKEN